MPRGNTRLRSARAEPAVRTASTAGGAIRQEAAAALPPRRRNSAGGCRCPTTPLLPTPPELRLQQVSSPDFGRRASEGVITAPSALPDGYLLLFQPRQQHQHDVPTLRRSRRARSAVRAAAAAAIFARERENTGSRERILQGSCRSLSSAAADGVIRNKINHAFEHGQSKVPWFAAAVTRSLTAALWTIRECPRRSDVEREAAAAFWCLQKAADSAA